VPDPKLTMEVQPGEEGGYEVVHRLMEMNPKPDALFCFSDHIAIGAMEECLKQGIRIPEDLAIVGYADLDHSNMLKIPLTTVHQPRDLMGQTAADMLSMQMEGQTPEVAQVKLPVELVIRESTVGKS
jgi:LacI family transcriptional regulator